MPLFSLSKAEKLKSRKAIDRLFQKGKSFSCYPIRVVYYIEKPKPQESSGLKMTVSVPKKTVPKAVNRNQYKRQVREAYRTNKAVLKEAIQSKNIELQLMYIYLSKKEESFQQINKSIAKSLDLLLSKIN